MAYDEDLANRIRESLAEVEGVTEMKMFGGLGFMVGGHMAVAASGKGSLMVRVNRGETGALLAEPHAEAFEMRGRAMRGWLLVAAEGVKTRCGLDPWAARGVAYVHTLPPKR